MSELDATRVHEYFSASDAVAEWWNPECGPLSFHYAAELRVIEEQLVIDPRWRVLDLGTGRGRFGLHFASAGCSVVGIDVNPAMRDLARDAARRRGLDGRFEVRAGDAHDLRGTEDASYDVIVCMETFDHLVDLERALDEIARVLAPGGLLIASFVPGTSLYGMCGNLARMIQKRVLPHEVILSRTHSASRLRARLRERRLRLTGCYGVGLLCLNAQTRLFRRSRLLRALDSIARFEASRQPYVRRAWLAPHAAHVVAFARREPDAR